MLMPMVSSSQAGPLRAFVLEIPSRSISVASKMKNPQTGVSFYLAGKPVAQLRVESVDGDTPDTQYAIVSVVSGSFDKGALDNYYVQQ